MTSATRRRQRRGFRGVLGIAVASAGACTVALGVPVTAGVAAADPSCPCSIWSPTATPLNPSASDSAAVEVGVTFRSDVDGTVTDIRFYKGPGNRGAHIGHLWAEDGTLLATATFSDETAIGWQDAVLSPPAPVAADQTYVASYEAPDGHYAADQHFFAAGGVDSPPLHALADTPTGGDGVYTYSPGSFPDSTYMSTNYWVDVVFSPTAPAALPETSVTVVLPLVMLAVAGTMVAYRRRIRRAD